MMQDSAYGYINKAEMVGMQAATTGKPTPMSPVLRLAAAVEAAEKTAALIHNMRIGMMGDVPDSPAKDAEYHGEGLIGRISTAAARIESANNRILRDLEDLHHAYGDF